MRLPRSAFRHCRAPLLRRRTRCTLLAVLGALAPATAVAQGYPGGGGGFGGGYGGGFGGFGGGSAIDRAIGLGVIGPAADDGEATNQSGWTFTSGVALSATYSDNANLTSTADAGQEDIFLQVLPYASLSGEGARVKARGYIAPALYTGTIGGSPARIAPFMDLAGTVELVPDAFFLDGYAKASMVNNNAAGPGGGLGYNNYQYNSDNITPAFSFQLSPYVLRHLGTTANFYARLGIGTTNYGDSSDNNALNANFESGFRSGSDFQRVPWHVFYRATRYDYNEQTSVDNGSKTSQQLVGRGSYVISPVWRVDASLGYENNDYQTSRGETSGPTWSLGATWTPNQRVALSLGYGGQYFGNSWYLDYRYSHKRIGWFASYRTQLTNTQQEFLQSQTFLLTGPDGLPVVDPGTGQPIQVTQVSPTLTNESYVLRTFVTGIGWTGNRTRAGLDITRNERDYQVTGEGQSDWGVGARVSRDLSSDVTATARASWTNYDQGSTGTSDDSEAVDRWQAGVLLTKKLSRQSSISGAYDYRSNLFGTTSGSSGSGSSGDENRVAVIFNHAF